MGLRPGYKQTEVGVIPENWEVSTLGRITECLDNVRVPLNEMQRLRRTGDYPYCGANGVLDYIDGFVLDGDIILVAEDGGYFDEFETRPIAYRMSGKCWVNNHAHILKAKGGISQDYVFYSLVHKNILRYLASGTRAKLNRSEMDRIEIGLPRSLPEQRAIAGALGDVDALLGALSQLIAKKRDLKQAAMQQLLTGQTRLPGFSGEWEAVTAGEVGRLRGGTGFPLRLQGKSEGIYPFYKVSDMNNEGNETFMDASNNWISESVRKDLGPMLFPANSIVFAKVGAAIFLERKKILTRPSYIDNNMTAFVLNAGRADFRFVHYLLLDTKLSALVATTALPSLNGKQLSELPLTLPPLPEQTAIAAVLSDMDAELTALEQRLAKIRALKQGMMQELLTGRTRLL